MLNYAETPHVSTNVSLSSVSHKQETGPLPSLTVNLNDCVMLYSGKAGYYVSPTLRNGYLAACKLHTEMEEQDEYGAYIFLSGYEYAHLARQYMPAGLSPKDKREWHRGFVLGWNACTLVL